MFTSKRWKSNEFAETKNGKFVEDLVLDKEFWKDVMICYKGANPLVQVLRLVSSIDEPAMGFIYEAMEKAKELIQRLSKSGIERYTCSVGSSINFSFKIEHLFCNLGLNRKK